MRQVRSRFLSNSNGADTSPTPAYVTTPAGRTIRAYCWDCRREHARRRSSASTARTCASALSAAPRGVMAGVEAFPEAPLDVLLDVRKRLRGPRAAFVAALRRVAEEIIDASGQETLVTESAFDVARRILSPAASEIRDELQGSEFRRELTRVGSPEFAVTDGKAWLHLTAAPQTGTKSSEVGRSAFPKLLVLREGVHKRRPPSKPPTARSRRLAAEAAGGSPPQQADDAFGRFAEELDRFSTGEDDGWAAYRLHELCEELFGVESEAVAGWERELGEGPTFRQPTFDVASLVPVSDPADAEFATTILERTMLYSGLTALVLPVRLSTMYTSYNANESFSVLEPASATHLLEAKLLYVDLVATRKCVFVPAVAEFDWGAASSDWRHG